MTYDIFSFVSKLKDYFSNSPLFPYMYGEYLSGYGIMQDSAKKHPKRSPAHLKDMTIQCLSQTTQFVDENIIMFDLGNEKMEKYYPYYHILQDTPFIRKKNTATRKTKGSQAEIKDLGKRDYGITSWNGKTFSKEYTRNVRGGRNRLEKSSHYAVINGKPTFINRDSGIYNNVHYHYIDNILDDDVCYKLSLEFGMKLMRKKNSGLAEEYFMELGEVDNELENDILSTFFSFE